MVGVVFSSFFVFSSVSGIAYCTQKESLKLRVGRDLRIQLVRCSTRYMHVSDSSSSQCFLRPPRWP